MSIITYFLDLILVYNPLFYYVSSYVGLKVRRWCECISVYLETSIVQRNGLPLFYASTFVTCRDIRHAQTTSKVLICHRFANVRLLIQLSSNSTFLRT